MQEFPACWPTLQTLHLQIPTIMWTNSLKINLSVHLNIGVMLTNMKMPLKEGWRYNTFTIISVYDIIATLPRISFSTSPEAVWIVESESPLESWNGGNICLWVMGREWAQNKGVGGWRSALAWSAFSLVLSSEGESRLLTSVYLKCSMWVPKKYLLNEF